MNYRNIEDLKNRILQKGSMKYCDYSAKKIISKPDVLCLESENNQVVSIHRISDKPLFYSAKIEFIFELETFKDTLKSSKYFPFLLGYALEVRNKSRKLNQA